MNMIDELERLGKLHSDGTLSDEEFVRAKQNLLNEREERAQEERTPEASEMDEDGDNSLGRAANRYVSFQIVSAVLGFILFLIFLFVVMLPSMNHGPSSFPMGPNVQFKMNR